MTDTVADIPGLARPDAYPHVDGMDGRFEYQRLSLTDVSNFKCIYCLPDGYRKPCATPHLASIGG